MDLLALLRLTLRRWIVVVPVLLLTALAGAWMVTNRSVAYEVKGVELLVSQTDESGFSPLSAPVAAEVLTDLLEQPSVRSQTAAAGLSDSYTASVSATGAAVRLTVTADTAELATQTAASLIERAPTLLTSGVGEELAQSVTIRPLAEPSTDDAESNSMGEYVTTSSIVITENPVVTTNPFPPTAATVSLLLPVASASSLTSEIEGLDPTAAFSATTDMDPQRSVPFFTIDVTASTPDLASEIFDTTLQSMNDELARIQDDSHVPDRIRTLIRPLVPPSAPTEALSSLVRPLAGVVVLGGGLAAALAVLVESIVAGRRLRRQELRSRTRGTSEDKNAAP